MLGKLSKKYTEKRRVKVKQGMLTYSLQTVVTSNNRLVISLALVKLLLFSIHVLMF